MGDRVGWSGRQPWLRWALALAIGLGVVLRFGHLDRQVYWGDEVFSSFRVAGYTLAEVTDRLYDNQPRTVVELQAQFQQPNPARSVIDTVRSLAQDDPQHPPLYYLLARWWEELAGGLGLPNTVGLRRLLTALLSLLAIPAAGALAAQLFGSSLAGWIAAAIAALSPFNLLYAQEVREYGLWSGLLALAGWLLARALQRNRPRDWALWAIGLTLLLYTHLFSVVVTGGYGLAALWWLWRSRAGRSAWLGLWISSGAAGLAFLPWAIATLQNLATISRTNGFTAQPVAFGVLLQNWWLNLARPFIDGEPTGQILANPIAAQGSIALVAVLVAVSGWNLITRESPLARSLLLGLMGSQGAMLVLLDLSQGGFRSAIIRYLGPCYLGLQVMVAGSLARSLRLNPGQSPRPWIGVGALLLVLLGSVGSSLTIAQSPTWWSKQGSYAIGAVAQAIAVQPAPWIAAQDAMPRVFSLSYQLPPETMVQFLRPGTMPTIPADRDLILFRPNDTLRQQLTQAGYRLDQLFQTGSIYPYLPPLDQQAQIWLDRVSRQPKPEN
ncbi:MAG: hypothetical protein EA001_04000 [Oscillatoriales cyanobacterium]|nr:MAG: hypothetical protein EA001_04000 [Oscillatoriales cyanobacterium]